MCDEMDIEIVSESRTVELDLILECKIFSEDELREYIRESKGYDYKVKNSQSIRDHLEYIKYKSNLVTAINKSNCSTELKKKTVNNMALKVIKLYKNAIARFPGQYRLYENLFLFCKRTKQIADISPYLSKWTKEFKTQSDPWIQAIYWEYEVYNNVERARNYASQGLLSIPTSAALYKTVIKMELDEAKKQINAMESSGNNDNLLNLSVATKKAENLYEHSKKNIFDINFLIDILKFCESYKYSYNLQNKIIKDLMELFPRHTLTWHTLAQRELQGHLISESISSDNSRTTTTTTSLLSAEAKSSKATLSSAEPKTSKTLIVAPLPIDQKSKKTTVPLSSETITAKIGVLTVKEEPDTNDNISKEITEKFTRRKQMERCAKIYNKGGMILQTVEMWTMFIDAMIDLNIDSLFHPVLKRKYLLAAYKGAYRYNCLTEEQYFQFIVILESSVEPEECDELLVAVLRKATQTYTTSIELWKLYMKFYIKRNNESKLRDIFYLAVKKTGKESLDIWLLFKQYLLCKYTGKDRNSVQRFFIEAIRFNDENIAAHFKALYIQWTNDIFGMEGMDETRYLFRNLLESKSQSYEMYKAMIEINSRLLSIHRINVKTNSGQVDKDFEETKKCYEQTIGVFGKTKPDLWVDYIKFIKDYDLPKNINLVHDRAIVTLDPEFLDNFRSHYNLLSIL